MVREQARKIITDTRYLLLELAMAVSGGSTGKPEVQSRQAPGSRPPINLNALAAQQWERATLRAFAEDWGWQKPGNDGDRIDYLRMALDDQPDSEVARLVNAYRSIRPGHLALWPIEDSTVWVDSREAMNLTGRSLGVLKHFASKVPMLSRVDDDRGLMFDRNKLELINAASRRA